MLVNTVSARAVVNSGHYVYFFTAIRLKLLGTTHMALNPITWDEGQ